MTDLDTLDRDHLAKFDAWRTAREEYTRLWRDASAVHSDNAWLLKSLTERARAAREKMTRAEQEYRAAKTAVDEARRARSISSSETKSSSA